MASKPDPDVPADVPVDDPVPEPVDPTPGAPSDLPEPGSSSPANAP